MKKFNILSVAAAAMVLSFVGAGCETAATPKSPADTAKITAFASCITEKGAKFYGTSWCPHCKVQKAEFGEEAMKLVNYIECAPPEIPQNQQAKACDEAGIKGYPTWVFADGSRAEGAQSFKELSAKTGCEWSE